MSHFIVDETRCRRDGICVAVCPIGILTRGDAALLVGEPRYQYHRLPQRREPSITWRSSKT